MSETPIARALISVSDKTGLVPFARELARHKVRLLSTGGTAKALKEAGLAVTEVSAYTGFPEIMDGRVKTLHPTIHGGVLADREDPKHRTAMEGHDIAPIDLVVVNLYPFVETIQSGADYQTCIENIDIGGPAMIRAAAKNHRYVTVVTDPAEYDSVIRDMDDNDGATSVSLRSFLALEAYARTSSYDSTISAWLAEQQGRAWPKRMTVAGRVEHVLRYGENPHQEAAVYRSTPAAPGVATAARLQGKELSFNNYNDADAALMTVAEFDAPAVAIVKHANPCGVAQHDHPTIAWDKAVSCDPVSAYGGVVAVNRRIEADLARKLTDLFLEVVIAPGVSEAAAEALAKKPNLRVLTTDIPDPAAMGTRMVKSISGGMLLQSADAQTVTREACSVVTQRQPTEAEWRDLLFAWRVAKHVKSNAIVYARNLTTVGVGAGQMSRIDSSRIAALKAGEHLGAEGSVVASDAFFPFPDGLLAAVGAGATAAIQPGGSIRDDAVIQAADAAGIAMVFTGERHFLH
ncbi:MAG: bifunctional phosphoribosylaminoimidazolecarboxamide formyltransferase/IMP cyclohydrolase [Alphaproteobacteria bacterium]|nr:bifunctional phosphoribosylaminoimidazolecarboxamide formyltransferase/IMP cyclohydrolase [Alphaproteobacteria bacterium]